MYATGKSRIHCTEWMGTCPPKSRSYVPDTYPHAHFRARLRRAALDSIAGRGSGACGRPISAILVSLRLEAEVHQPRLPRPRQRVDTAAHREVVHERLSVQRSGLEAALLSATHRRAPCTAPRCSDPEMRSST